MKPKPAPHYRNYAAQGGRYSRRATCPVCRCERLANSSGKMLEHYHNQGRMVLAGQGVLCAGVGAKALVAERAELYYAAGEL